MAVAQDRLSNEITRAIDAFMSETRARDAETRTDDANITNLRRDLEGLANAVSAKGRDLSAANSNGGGSGSADVYYRATASSGGGRPMSPPLRRPTTAQGHAGPVTPHRHVHDDKALVQKWSTPQLARSKLLSGSSALRHLPGAQYCIDAGLHHHHHRSSATLELSRRGGGGGGEWDAAWFVDMERKLKGLAEQLASLAGAPDQSRLALLLRHLQELNGLYQDKTRRDADLLKALEAEWERRAKAILDDCYRVLNEDRARWLQFIMQLREAYERDLARLEAELRARFEQAMAQMKDAHAREVRGLNDEIERLRALLRNQPGPAPPSGPNFPDLSGLVRELRGTIADRDDEIARLKRLLAEQHFVVKVKEPTVHIPYKTNKASEGRSQVWSSGAVARGYLNKTNPFPTGTEIDVEKGDVRVYASDGTEADPAKFTVKYIVN